MRRLFPAFALALLAPALAPAQRLVTWGDTAASPVPAGLGVVRSGAIGDGFALALRPNRTVAAWGANGKGQSNVPSDLTNAIQVTAGFEFAVALLGDGTLEGWGTNADGERPSSAIGNITAVAAGGRHCLALTGLGRVSAWGANDMGQSNVPSSVSSVVQVAAGTDFSLALRSDGGLYGWGDNSVGQLFVPSGNTFIRVAAAGKHTVGLKGDGTVIAWGANDKGQSTVPTGLASVVDVAAGENHSLALKADGTVVAWGDPSSAATTVPVGLAGVLSISAGRHDSAAVVAAAYTVLDQKEIFGGDSATGEVRLAQPAGAGGVQVGLVCDDAGVTVPATVTVPEGNTTVTYPVFSQPEFAADRSVTIHTDFGGTATVPFKLKVKKSASVSMTLTRSYVISGSSTNVYAQLRLGWTLPADATIELVSSDPAVRVPATIVIKAGKTNLNVLLEHDLVSHDRTVTIQARYRGATLASGTLGLRTLKGTIRFASSRFPSGDATTGVLELNTPVRGPITFNLKSSDYFVSVPATVTVNPGSQVGVFAVTTNFLVQDTTFTVTATSGEASFSGGLTLTPTCWIVGWGAPDGVSACSEVPITPSLSMPAPRGGYVVRFTSNSPYLTFPGPITIPYGKQEGTVKGISGDVPEDTQVTYTILGVNSGFTFFLTVHPLTVDSLVLSDTTLQGGRSTTGTVAVAHPVLVDCVVGLSSSDPSVTVPTTVTVKAGSRTATFTIQTSTVTVIKNVRVTASKAGSSVYRTLKVTP